jgi:murein DD-endopeptidase MepM/ murein hydrolase activator NlpD
MKRARRWVAGIAVLVATGSCIEPRPMVVAAIARPAVVAPASPAGAVLPGDFALRGHLSQGGMAIGTAPPDTVGLTLDGAPVTIAPDGAFLIAFDRDAGSSATLAATRRDGTTLAQVLTIAPRAWNISRLATLPKYPVPPADFDRLRPPELAQINAARHIDSGATGWREPFQWPATGRISTLFGSQRIYQNGEAGSYHSGIDIAVPQGTPVLAPADGVVILASDHAFLLEGNLLMIDHGMGLNSALMHLSRIVVAAGQHVARGQVVAYSGMTGRVTGAHLHWSLRWRNAKIDPLLVAGAMPASH